ncbi:MAG TPA: hypothetical protein VNO33_15775 [Kofleriaceae bacterium]|nr:hypothetical protein [Kofleriaceae bacterium]
MQTMVFASSLIRSKSGPAQLEQRALELQYSPWRGVKDAIRLTAAIGGMALFSVLLDVVL